MVVKRIWNFNREMSNYIVFNIVDFIYFYLFINSRLFLIDNSEYIVEYGCLLVYFW